jgi:hypothetical protein
MSSAGVQDRWKRDSGGNIDTYEGYMPPDSLTTHLLELDVSGFERATRSTFLEKAGKGTLNKDVLQRWLSQDRLYAQAYIRFASLLLANIPLPSFIKPDHINERYVEVSFSVMHFPPQEQKPPISRAPYGASLSLLLLSSNFIPQRALTFHISSQLPIVN